MHQRIAMLLSAAGMVVAVACSQTDPGITTAVKSKFAQDDTVKAYQIDVDTSGGVVTLTGAVETPAAREQAMLLARQTDGVTSVVDHLTVNPEAEATTGDLRDDARDLGADVRDKASEAGEATKDAARDARDKAADAAHKTGDVISDAAVTTAVKTKLIADSNVSGLNIDVDTENGVVTLHGTAKTRAEADHAAMLARDTKGVKRVVNSIKIAR